MNGEIILSKFLTPSNRKILKYSFFSSLLELYEFALYGVMLSILSKKFFPGNAQTQIVLAYLAFSLTFLVAPISSFIWGYIADKRGRVKMIRMTLNLMAFPSFIIAFLPTYDEIGVYACVILVICRILQGISSSGAYGGIKIFAFESIGNDHLGKTAGILSCAGALGVLSANFASFIVTKNPHMEDLWRYAFLVGSVLGVIGFLIRKRLIESSEFLKAKPPKPEELTFKALMTTYKKRIIVIFSVSSFLGLFSYSMHAFMVVHLTRLGFEHSFAYLLCIMALSCTCISAICIGFKIDFTKNENHITKVLACLIFVFPFCYSLFLSQEKWQALVAMVILGLFLGCYSPTINIINYKLFPTALRGRMLLLCYSLGVASFGGFAPTILNQSIKIPQNLIDPNLVPGFVLSFASFVVYLLIKFNRPNSQ